VLALTTDGLIWRFSVQDDFNRMEEINDIGIEAEK
jgi:hypothetical protein